MARMLARLYPATRPGGLAVIVDTIPDARATADLNALLQALQLGLRTPAGAVHDCGEYTAWLEAAGYVVREVIPLTATRGWLSALVAQRPE